MIEGYLAQYTKKLSPARLERVAAARQAANPLYLCALLEELRVFGVYELLDERIDHYLAAGTVPQLYEKILERWEKDYQRDRRNLVRDAMTSIWASRRGLLEWELLELLQTKETPLPRIDWSPLYLAAEKSLVSWSGMIGFFHDHLREAVRNRYLPSWREQQEAHLRLAAYFKDREAGPRRTEELPWQIAEGEAWQSLRDLLSDAAFFTSAWRSAQYDVKSYWAAIERNSPLRAVDAYQAILKTPDTDIAFAEAAAGLLADFGENAVAAELEGSLIRHFRTSGERDRLQTWIGNHALTLKNLGRTDEATELYDEQERVYREMNDLDGLQCCLGNRAAIFELRGQFPEAMQMQASKEQICHRMGNHVGLANALGSQGNILFGQGRLTDALERYRHAQRVCRESGNLDSLHQCLGGEGLCLAHLGEFDRAMAIHREQEQICLKLGARQGLQHALGAQANCYRSLRQFDKAAELHERQTNLCRESGDDDGLSMALGDHAMVLQLQGKLDEAIVLNKEEERISRRLGNWPVVAHALGGQASICCSKKQYQEALSLSQEQEQVCRRIGYVEGLIDSLGVQGLLYSGAGAAAESRGPRLGGPARGN